MDAIGNTCRSETETNQKKIEISFSLPNKVGQLAKALEIMKVLYLVYKLITTRSSSTCYSKGSPFHMIPYIILFKLLFLLLGAIFFPPKSCLKILMSFHYSYIRNVFKHLEICIEILIFFFYLACLIIDVSWYVSK